MTEKVYLVQAYNNTEGDSWIEAIFATFELADTYLKILNDPHNKLIETDVELSIESMKLSTEVPTIKKAHYVALTWDSWEDKDTEKTQEITFISSAAPETYKKTVITRGTRILRIYYADDTLEETMQIALAELIKQKVMFNDTKPVIATTLVK